MSFDTFDNRDATDFSLTLNYKHKDFQYTRRSRTFLCGTDDKDYSEFALEWLIDELLDDGDEIVCLRVVEKDSKIASDASIEKLKYREEAQKLLEKVIEKNTQDEKAISLVMELAVGKVQDVFKRMVQFFHLRVSSQRTLTAFPRYKYMNLPFSSSALGVGALVVFKDCSQVRFQNGAFSHLPFRL